MEVGFGAWNVLVDRKRTFARTSTPPKAHRGGRLTNRLSAGFGDRATDKPSRVGGSIGQDLSGLQGTARALQKRKVLVVELHHRENERRADTEQ
jgi:hypothetical protein